MPIKYECDACGDMWEPNFAPFIQREEPHDIEFRGKTFMVSVGTTNIFNPSATFNSTSGGNAILCSSCRTAIIRVAIDQHTPA